jgi:hypothetical protein
VTTPTKVHLGKLRQLIDQGLSTKQIAAHFGLQPPAITRTCRNHDIPLPHGGRTRAGWPAREPTREDDERDLTILRRVMRGFGIQATADRAGISNVTVQQIIKNIEAADLAESGESTMEVARFYANPRRRRA